MGEPLGIIGLGRVGRVVADAYLQDGHTILGYDTDPSTLAVFAAGGGTPAKSAEEVARHASIIFILVLNDDQVTDVITGTKGVLRGATAGSTVICMSTINRDTMETVARRCDEKQIHMVDCPFTGGPARAASRNLTLIAAAPTEILDRVRPLLEGLGTLVCAGSLPGQGQAVKHCNQLLVGATHAVTMEVITLAQKLGLDADLVTSVVASGIAGSDYFRLLADSVLQKTPSPGGLGQMCKDMDIVQNTLRKTGMRAEVGYAAARYFSAAHQRGLDGGEGADLIEVVRAWSGKQQSETKNI